MRGYDGYRSPFLPRPETPRSDPIVKVLSHRHRPSACRRRHVAVGMAPSACRRRHGSERSIGPWNGASSAETSNVLHVGAIRGARWHARCRVRHRRRQHCRASASPPPSKTASQIRPKNNIRYWRVAGVRAVGCQECVIGLLLAATPPNRNRGFERQILAGVTGRS